ncbi:CS054-like protein [Mya arenaria]|uniref:Actin maturation protease n=1 Tax=Mya arenaria TaxID=6604 RepID=A0ABY7G761_MYAAR|nr:CS054-like protein [Mya arenaria]
MAANQDSSSSVEIGSNRCMNSKMSSLSSELDEDSTYSPTLFTPPPLAPVPPPPPFSRTHYHTTTNGIQTDVNNSAISCEPEAEGQRAYTYACSAIPDNLENYVCVSYQRKVEPIIQSGPQCGLVALAMGESILQREVSLDQLTTISQAQGFSKQGEMFSANNMEQLARLAFGCKTSVLDIRDVSGKWEFLNCLARGDILLVPYDPDKNYVPVLKKGFFAAISDDQILTRLQTSSVKKDSEFSNLYHCSIPPLPSNTGRVLPVEPNITPRALSAIVPARPQGAVVSNRAISARTLPAEPPKLHGKENTKLCHSVGNLSSQKTAGAVTTSNSAACRNPLEAASYILVYAKQGKSKYTGIWNAKTLVESCCNLIEIDPQRLRDEENYAFPDKGIEEELCGKVVVLHVKK